MTWTRGRRELAFSGRLPLEQGTAFEQAIWSIAKDQRAADKQAGTILEWQQSAADALVTLARQRGERDGGVRRSPTTLIVHLSDDAPPLLEGAGPISPETAERLTCDARRLIIKPSWSRPRALTRRRAAPPTPSSAHCTSAQANANTPAAPPPANSKPTTSSPSSSGGKTELDNLILLCPRHHKLLHDHHIHTSGHAEQPAFEDAAGRAITTNQPHAPPH